MRVCKDCGESKPETEFHNTGSHRRKDGAVTMLYKPDCKSCANKKWKRRIAEKLGRCGVVWKCAHCGYDKSIVSLDMHHLDPTQKEFAIASRWTITEEKLKAEVEKCIVLCSNCHRELHAGEWSIDDIQ